MHVYISKLHLQNKRDEEKRYLKVLTSQPMMGSNPKV